MISATPSAEAPPSAALTATDSVPRLRVGWRAWVSLAVWVPSTIGSLSLPGVLVLFALWAIPAPEQGDFLGDLADGTSEAGVLVMIGAALTLLWALTSVAIAHFGGTREIAIMLTTLDVFTTPIRWWHRIVSRFATVPLITVGTLLGLFWFVSALITTASRDGWDGMLFLWMLPGLILITSGLTTGLFSRWGANQYGSYMTSLGSIWILVLLPVVALWAGAALAVALLPVAPLALGGMLVFGDHGFASVVEGIPLDSVWAPLALQPFPVFWLTSLVLVILYWLPASTAWLLNGYTATRMNGLRWRTVLSDSMRVIYTFPIGPRDR